MASINLLELPDGTEKFRSSGVHDDFHYYSDADLWTKLAADSGASAAAGNVHGGKLVLTTGGTDNNEAAVKATAKTLVIQEAKAIFVESLIDYAEANTSAANVAVGLSSAATANTLLDDGGGPAASFTGALIYKIDGGTVWKCVSSVGTTQTISTSTKTAGGSAQQRLRIEIRGQNDGTAEVAFFVDGQQLIDSTTLRPIKHSLAYASASAAGALAYIKAGSSSSEVLNVDYLAFAATR